MRSIIYTRIKDVKRGQISEAKTSDYNMKNNRPNKCQNNELQKQQQLNRLIFFICWKVHYSADSELELSWQKWHRHRFLHS